MVEQRSGDGVGDGVQDVFHRNAITSIVPLRAFSPGLVLAVRGTRHLHSLVAVRDDRVHHPACVHHVAGAAPQ
eukprot:1204700-Prymnesium_polylepis.1